MASPHGESAFVKWQRAADQGLESVESAQYHIPALYQLDREQADRVLERGLRLTPRLCVNLTGNGQKWCVSESADSRHRAENIIRFVGHEYTQRGASVFDLST